MRTDQSIKVVLSARPRDVIRDCAGIRARKASRALNRLLDEAIRPAGIKSTQLAILVSMSEHPECSTAEHARRLGIERTTMIRNVQVLERDGLAIMIIADQSRVPCLTASGCRVLDRALPYWAEAQERIRSTLGDRWAAALDYLEIIAALR